MLRWLTAGESHGPALVGIIEGMPAGVEITSEAIQSALARRRLGYGRGARMKFEQDEVRIVGGVRHGLTQGGPANATQTVATQSYQRSFVEFKFGQGAALSNILILISLVFAVVYLRATRRRVDE